MRVLKFTKMNSHFDKENVYAIIYGTSESISASTHEDNQ